MNDIRLYGTHIPMLVKTIDLSDGPILELGMGISTWIIDMMCKQTGRKIVSYENDPRWHAENLRYASNYHDVLLVSDWNIIPIGSTHWSVVLVDHRPALRRHVEALRVKDNADYIILHDTEPEIDKFYRYSKIYKHFKYRFTYDKCKPYTTVVSNFKDLSNL